MQGKIALEEHWELPASNLPTTFGWINEEYVTRLATRLPDIDRRLEEMDATGIATSVLSLTQPGIQHIVDRKTAVDLARRMNDYAAETLAHRDPSRLKTFACVALQDPEQAALEATRACKELGCIGILVNGFTDLGDDTAQYMDEPQVLPFWQAVSDLGVPVYLHPRMPLMSQRKSYAGYPGIVASSWGFGHETATHALRLILSGLFDRFPKLNVVLGH